MPRSTRSKRAAEVKAVSSPAAQSAPLEKPAKSLDLISSSNNGSVTAKVSLGEGPNYATYHPDREIFARNLNVRSVDQFSLERTTITEGESKGHQAVVLVPVPKRQFAFLDLPTEVRLLIYEELFTRNDDGSHDIWRVNHSNAREDVLVGGRTGKLYFTWITPRVWGGEFRVPWCARQTMHGINILRTNKHIDREAMAVLYGNNHWRFSSTSTMRIWLEAVGPNARAVLQSVELGGDRADFKFYSQASAKKAASLLAACPNLQLLRFDFWWHWIRDRYPPAQLVTAWKPVFDMLAERDGRATIRSKVRIGQDNWACGARHAWDKDPDKSDTCQICRDIKALNSDYEDEFQDEVRRVMGWL